MSTFFLCFLSIFETEVCLFYYYFIVFCSFLIWNLLIISSFSLWWIFIFLSFLFIMFFSSFYFHSCCFPSFVFCSWHPLSLFLLLSLFFYCLVPETCLSLMMLSIYCTLSLHIVITSLLYHYFSLSFLFS